MMYYQTLQAQIDDVRASGKERIVKILSPEQREKFNRMLSELQARQLR
jgi:Spy/CpxP family protein refolding chaperone